MRNIILVDRYITIIDDILNNTDYNIEILIVDCKKFQEKYENNSRIRDIVLIYDLLEKENIELFDMDLILKYKYTQLKVESSLQRVSLDYQRKKFAYYNALTYWHGVFEKNNVDFVIMVGTNHGGLHDCILQDVAIEHKVSCYNLETDIYQKRFLVNYTKNFFIKLNNNLDVNKEEIIFSPIPKKEGEIRKIIAFTKTKYNKLSIKNIFKSVIELKFGYYMLIFLFRIMFNQKYFHIWGFKTDWKRMLFSVYRLKNIIRYREKKEEKMKKNEKYIFYPLVFDPDAGGNSARHILDSQLLIIECISKALPTGWKLYVKEHPLYYNLDCQELFYYYVNIETYRNEEFYDSILQNSNVRLIDINTSSHDLVNNAECVAMMQGTIMLDVLNNNKPLLLFSDRNVLSLCKDIFKILSYKDCEQAIKKIERGYRPEYSNLNTILRDYLVNYDKDGLKSIINAIEREECT